MESQSGVKPTNPRKKTKTKGLDEDYWNKEDPLMVTGKDGKSYPVTYSFDSEVPHSVVFNLIYSDPEATAKLTLLLRKLRQMEKTGVRTEAKPYLIDRDELKRILEKSDKQLNTFVLRRGVDPDKEYFDLTDLNASYVDDFMIPILKQYNQDKKITDTIGKSFNEKSVDEFFEGYKQLADEVFSKENIPANPTRDQMWIEMVHKSSESSPAEYRSLMLDRYQPMANNASSHLHVGVPAVVSQEKMLAIGRAVEARIILENARSTSKPGELYATSYSTLVNGASDAKRSAGVVRMNYNRFKEPHVAHDLEIRQYNRMEEGMNNIALAGKMATNHDKIKVIDMPKLKKIDDPSTSNLIGALSYTGRALASSNDPDFIMKSKKLEEMVRDIEKAGEITPEKRVEIQQFLKEEKILESFDDRLLLEEE